MTLKKHADLNFIILCILGGSIIFTIFMSYAEAMYFLYLLVVLFPFFGSLLFVCYLIYLFYLVIKIIYYGIRKRIDTNKSEVLRLSICIVLNVIILSFAIIIMYIALMELSALFSV